MSDMATKERLKLVALYDENHNEYSILAFNQSAEEARRIVDERQPQLAPGTSLITPNQTRRYPTTEPTIANCTATP
jgi:hypothetical protein